MSLQQEEPSTRVCKAVIPGRAGRGRGLGRGSGRGTGPKMTNGKKIKINKKINKLKHKCVRNFNSSLLGLCLT